MKIFFLLIIFSYTFVCFVLFSTYTHNSQYLMVEYDLLLARNIRKTEMVYNLYEKCRWGSLYHSIEKTNMYFIFLLYTLVLLFWYFFFVFLARILFILFHFYYYGIFSHLFCKSLVQIFIFTFVFHHLFDKRIKVLLTVYINCRYGCLWFV